MAAMAGRAENTPLFALPAVLLLAGAPQAAGQEASSRTYAIKPSRVSVPDDVALGQYRRIIRPFENWTLICDENLETRKRVCNVTQVITDRTGGTAFSWSLAATSSGKPYMILRAPPAAESGGLVSLRFEGRRRPVDVRFDGCNEQVCVAKMPVGAFMRAQIGKKTTPRVSYTTRPGESVTVNAPLKGLASALSAINQ